MLLWAFVIVAAMVIGRLFYVQVVQHKLYAALALGQQTGFTEVKGRRGEVFFKNSRESKGAYASGEVKSLAINKEKWMVYAIANNISDRAFFAKTLSPHVGETETFILSKMEESKTYAVIKKDLEEEEMKTLKGLELQGLYFENFTARYYPQEMLAAQVIGFLGGGGEGQYGIEGYYEEELMGKTGIKEEKRGLNLISANLLQEDLDGSDVYLTIDYNIQFQAEALLKQAAKDIDIESGQVIVLKPDSGRILALANYPFFDPNKYSKEKDFAIFQNSAVQKVFEPGSVFKPFTMAIALNEGKVSADTKFNDTGSVAIGPDTIYNFNREKYGEQTLSGILEKSINTGAVYLSKLVLKQTFISYLEKLGFDKKTGVDLQGEVSSKNELLKKGSPFGFATASFGQGIEMTPIQFAAAFSIFANGGHVVKPYITEKISGSQKEIKIEPQLSEQVISSKVATQVTTMLINVVERGFGNGARIPGYYLAGKTGTAEVPLKTGKGYYEDRTVQSFIGFGPALKPEFLILVKLDNPKVPKSSLSAVPIFKKLSQYIINYWQLPPDY